MALGDGVDAWAALGAELLEGVGTGSGAALAYFRTLPFAVDVDERARWVHVALRIAAVTPPLAAAFCESTVSLVGRVPGSRLDAFADEVIALRTQSGWRGERLAYLLVSAAHIGVSRLGPGQFVAWHEVATALAGVEPEAHVLRELPAAVAQWSDGERDDWLAWVLALGRRRPVAGWALYRGVPAAISGLSAEERAGVLRAGRRAGPVADPVAQEALAPVLGALVAALPTAQRAHALAQLDTVAAIFPAGVPGFLRSLARVYEEAPAARVAEWCALGLTLAADRPAAGLAFFALESRTSRRVLQASPTAVPLEDIQGVARRFIHMLTGRSVALSAEGGLRIGLPFEDGTDGGALPVQVDCGPTSEDNTRVYRALSALLAARRLYGTYDEPALLEHVRDDPRAILEPCFRTADGYRVACRLAAAYPGLAGELDWLGRHLTVCWADAAVVDAPFLADALLAFSLIASAPAVVPADWLAPAVRVAMPLLRSLATPTATAADALTVAELLVTLVPFPASGDTAAAELSEYARFMMDLGSGDDVLPRSDGDGLGGNGPPIDDPDAPPPALAPELQMMIDEQLDEAVEGGRPLDAAELERLLQSGVLPKLSQAEGLTPQQAGLYVTQLMGKLLAAQPSVVPPPRSGTAAALRRARPATVNGSAVYLYDEWDHEVGDYRAQWCRLRELALPDDAGVFFTRTLERHAALVPEIRRHFQRVLPDTYRPVRGLEDGEDFDLNAVVDARIQHRAGHGVPSKLYTARVRQEREVATLFLLDMSASTDESPASAEGRRIIDIAKEALVLMAAALDEIGDACAIYGFSGQGREQVEVFPVKSFHERLTPAVKGRIGGIEPKGSTRMGTAIRHVLTKLQRVTAPSRHVILLSDGFPQDLDYGRDRHSHTYGIRDTAVALQELEAHGVKPFCITVDLAGHDYLRTMCDPQRYLVIERVIDLPRVLPKIYQRVVRGV